LESNLLEIEKLASSKRSRALLTSRPEYFVSVREESEALSPRINPFLYRDAEYEPLKILPWNGDQVETILTTQGSFDERGRSALDLLPGSN
jgi:hypothetical protein